MRPRPSFAVASLLAASVGLSAACQNPAPAPGPRTAGAERAVPTHNENIDRAQRCAADAECPAGEICQSAIRAACETCDGGPVVQICERAPACADDTNCQAPRTCQAGGCR